MSFDFWGYIFLFISLGCAMVALHIVGEMKSKATPLVIALIAGCLISGVAFVLVELYTEKNPIVPIRLMMKNGIGLICIGQIMLVFCQYGVRKLSLPFPQGSVLRILPAHLELCRLCHSHSICAE